MSNWTYKEGIIPSQAELVTLYNDVNWTAYTDNPEQLLKAIQNSLYVLTVWNSGQLIGLLRAVGDGQTILYIQDILVLEAYQRKGIGKELMDRTLAKYPTVRQKMLLTDDTPKTRAFYQSMGFIPCEGGQVIAFARLENQGK